MLGFRVPGSSGCKTPHWGVSNFLFLNLDNQEHSLTLATMSHLEASHLFSIKGHVAVVTGGGSGKS